MLVMSVGASSLAHGVHYAVLGIGLLGLVVLLGPPWVGARKQHLPRDEHERRVAALHRQLGAGTPTALVLPRGPRTTRATRAARPGAARTGAALPIAIISSTAAASVHAAVGPAHFRELFLFGLFFAGSATAQIIWSLLMVLRPTRSLVVAAGLGNAVVLVLWAVTRTVGLPFGLLPSPEAVGPWDLCCGVWEAVVVVACAALLRSPAPLDLHVATWERWPRSARTWAVVSVLALGVLSVSGAGA
ncbi:MAG: hypothetical protein JWQ74_1248 [Marmoricola sp.]|nr:hypothetical protein [Marmoricola sp.]